MTYNTLKLTKYLVNLLYNVMQHMVGVWKTVHTTNHDHIYATRATHFENTCKTPIKTLFIVCFRRDFCSYYYVIKTGLDRWLDCHGPVQSLRSFAVKVRSSLRSFAVSWTGPSNPTVKAKLWVSTLHPHAAYNGHRLLPTSQRNQRLP